MSVGDEALYEKVMKIENKDVFVDLKSNQNGVYLKISERNGSNRNSILIPSSGIQRLGEVLLDVARSSEYKDAMRNAGDKGVSPLRAERDANTEVKMRSVYVSNLSWDTEETELTDHMKQAGNVLNTVVLRRNGRSLGCGIVEYDTPETAQYAVEIMNDSDLDGRNIHVREDKVAQTTETKTPAAGGKKGNKAQKKRASQTPAEDKVVEPNKVFVSNLTWSTSEEELITCFCSVGNVVAVEIRQTRGGRSLGCGVVEFANADDAKECIDTMNGQDLNGRAMAIREYYQ
mmetsp:Transcript_21696/g.31571  ORF Transcript_21696/g.31571 Transcript_21696/m.31571 type:complete len:288 (-) Transcript_21696:147-1010(-)